ERLKNDVRAKLDDCKQALDQTIALGRAEDHGFKELHQLKACQEAIEKLDRAIDNEANRRVINSTDPEDLMADERPTGKAAVYLILAADDLIRLINEELKKRAESSRNEHKFSQIVLIATSSAGVVFMLGLLRFLYIAVVKPVRLLERGVTRVARGDFEHRLEIKSGDEIESFANAYNQMAGKLNDMYGDLANQVNERSRQLVRSERLAGVGFLAAGVAHEINNPLASIAFCSEALEGRLGDVFDHKATSQQDRDILHKYLKMIQEEAFRCK